MASLEAIILTDRCALFHGDSRDLGDVLEPNSVDAIVCDPPAGIGFMGKAWDKDRGGRDAWIEWLAATLAPAFAALKPGGHALVWALPKTSHWTAYALELVGFEVRDRVSHFFGTGFPKNHDVSKAIDRLLKKDRPVVGANPNHRPVSGVDYSGVYAGGNTGSATLTKAGCPESAAWEGFGTALKPACEDWWLVRKPLAGTIARNVLEHGTGAINIDGCRIGTADELGRGSGGWQAGGYVGGDAAKYDSRGITKEGGRWPAHVVLSHTPECVPAGTRVEKGHKGYPNGPGGNNFGIAAIAKVPNQTGAWTGYADREVVAYACADDCPVRVLDAQVPSSKSTKGKPRKGKAGDGYGMTHTGAEYSDKGGPSRFFYVAKPGRKERDLGCESLDAKTGAEATDRKEGSAGVDRPQAGAGRGGGAKNFHPTVKASALMRWLVRLITPPGGTVLDPFAGSGSTGVAALAEGFDFIGVEFTEEYLPIIEARLLHALKESD